MSETNLALDYLRSLGGGGDSLEAVSPSFSEAQLRPTGPVPERHAPVVAAAVEKIGNAAPLTAPEQFALEAIIIPDKRPAIDVLAGGAFNVEQPIWAHLNQGAAKASISAASRSVGRIELPNHPSIPYGGTGFVVGPDLLMTNRHVAELFAQGQGRGIVFRAGETAGIDFERRSDGGSLFLDVKEVVLIHPYWDMALLRVRELPDGIVPLKLAASPDSLSTREVVTIGYPAFDPRNNAQVQQEVFNGRFDVKRLMPGFITGRGDIDSFGKTVSAGLHDSSTLGGASGSAVFDYVRGVVAGLHFGGIYLKSNFAVPAFELGRDQRLIDAGLVFDGPTVAADGPWIPFWREAEAEAPVAVTPPSGSRGTGLTIPPGAQQATITVPVTITVSLGGAANFAASATHGSSLPAGGIAWPGPAVLGGGEVAPVEGVADDYSDRRGYDPEFLGRPVPLPFVTRAADDILDFAGGGGAREKILRYEHFSVQMSRSRRMCLWSAVNIDGGQSRKAKRVGWRLDPRIAKTAQIINECYGNPPKFSRGHMTRREDPVWGDVATAERGNADSMCVTNTTPQMQAFNSPIWLALEDYALEHARSDAMRISVFTGPIFADDDPTMHGVRIPRRFWKVIAFIHDVSGKLSATGYQMSQEASLPAGVTEFVFGEFQSPQLAIATQVSLRSIEADAGVSFGDLAEHDPKSGVTEAAEIVGPLLTIEQIRFV